MRRIIRKGDSLSLEVCVADWPQLEVNRPILDGAWLSPCMSFGHLPASREQRLRSRQDWSPFLSLLKLFTLLFSLFLAAILSEQVKQLEKELWLQQEYYSN